MGPIPSVTLSRRGKIALSALIVLIVLIVLVVRLSGVYINYLWFGTVGHRNVYSTILWTKVSLFFIFGLLMALILCGNLVIAYLTKPPFRPMSPEQQNLQHYASMLEPRRRLLLSIVGLIALLSAGAAAQGDWSQWQLFLHGVPWGIKDPIFGKDVSFYTWDYPVYRILLGFGFSAVIFSLILSIALHYITGAIRLQTPGPKITMAARRQITILIFFFIALKAVAYWLDRYGMVFSERSRFTGASYTDVHAALPARTILFWIAIVLALGVLASLWLRSAVLPGIGFIVLIVFSILIGGIYPAIVQGVSVGPNASTKEETYISRNITATRYGYDIQTASGSSGTVTYLAYQATSNPETSAITQQNATVDNIRILDPNVISPTVTNEQKIAQPYGFADKLNVDRYTVGGQLHDYIVGVRQLTPSNLTGDQDNWINQYTVYTHGYGFVAAQASVDVTKDSAATPYTEGDIPPSGPLGLTVPQVYYGQGMNAYSVVGGKGVQPEYDGNQQRTRYSGSGGVSLSSLATRLAFAINYKQTNFILNNSVSAPGAKAIINRDPSALVKKIAPFLTIDGSPYPFVDKQTGHIMWMVDGYTTTSNYPYSERQSLSNLTGTSLRQDQPNTQINYIRNSVKATVDAYNGTVKLYNWDPSDPVLKSYASIFPHLVLPASAMPKDVLAHVRYPQDLFNVQRSLLAQYHITNPVSAYNGRGRWAVPNNPFVAGDQAQPSYYVLADKPTATDATDVRPEFQLTTPMIVPGNNASNLASYISVDSDPGPDYGKITVLQVPNNAAVDGPGQVANYFKTTAQISKDIQQLSQGQSSVIHGNLLTLPVGNSFLYVEPLYVQSTGGGTSFPTLQRVLVTYGNNIGYGATLQQALLDITAHRPAGYSLSLPDSSTTGSSGTGSGSGASTSPTSAAPTSSAPSTPTTSGLPTTVAGVLAALDQANAQLRDAKNLSQVSAALDRISRLSAQYDALRATPSATPTASASPSSTRSG